MIKHCCDSCGKDMDYDVDFKTFTQNSRRVFLSGGTISFNTPEEWELCTECKKGYLIRIQESITAVIKEIENATNKS